MFPPPQCPPRSPLALSTIYDIIIHHLLLNRWHPITDPREVGKSELQIILKYACTHNIAISYATTASLLFFLSSKDLIRISGVVRCFPAGRKPSAGGFWQTNMPGVTKRHFL